MRIYIVVQVGVYRHNFVPDYFLSQEEAVNAAKNLCMGAQNRYHSYEVYRFEKSDSQAYNENADAFQVASIKALLDYKTQERTVYVSLYK